MEWFYGIYIPCSLKLYILLPFLINASLRYIICPCVKPLKYVFIPAYHSMQYHPT